MNGEPAPLDVIGCALDGISLIEASAGTGKTWNICNLYLRLLLERELEAPQILVVTFTNAATAELRERVRARLAEALAHLERRAMQADPLIATLVDAAATRTGRTHGQLAQRIEAALGCFDEAAIYTIHGFCQRALADAPLAAGLPYGLELIEDDSELRHEAAADFWRARVAGAQSDPDLAAWLAGSRESPEAWAQLLKRILAKPLSVQVWPENLDAPAQPLRPALDAAFASAKAVWSTQRDGALRALIAGLDALNAKAYDEARVQKSAAAWDAWFATGDPLHGAIDARGRTELLSARNLDERKKSKKVPPRHVFFEAAQAVLNLRARVLEQLERQRLRLLRDMAREAGERLRKAKQDRRVVAFDDILYNAWSALRSGRQALAAALRKRYPVALIDEFQDTDPLQCEIFLQIYDGAVDARGPLFLVGDPKQAVYSFRNADLHTYLRAKQRASAQHTLAANQRSVAGLIEACNTLFAANPGGFILPGIAYPPATLGERVRPGFTDRSEPRGAGAPLRVWRLPKDGQGRHLLRDRVKELAVQATAAEISRLLREGDAARIRVGERNLQASDIAVLVRSHRQGSAMKQALGALGIGSVELSRESIYASRDAEELELVLAAILEPARARRVLAALTTELMGAHAGDIEALARDDAGLAERTARFDALRKTWAARGFGFMFREWLDGDGVSGRLLARADGERRLTNLLQLGELLQRAAQQRAAPDALTRWLATQRAESAAGEEAQLRLESDRNLVQIVTIHKAKGLEYGIVFCPFLWDGQRAPQRARYPVEYHDDEGRGVMDFRPGAAKHPAVRPRLQEEEAAEDVRLAYVALTRAVYRCYVIAGCYDYKGSAREASPRQSTRSLLNWLAAGAGLAHADWQAHELAAEAIEAAWQRIADAAEPHIRLVDLPREPGVPLAATGESPESFNALPAPARIHSGWRIGSFTGLASGAEHEAAASDHDARAATAALGPPPEALPPYDILRFPRGPSAGDCVHAMFERADFTDRSTWDAAITRALAEHPQRSAGGAAAALQRQMLRLMEDVLGTSIAPEVMLSQVPRDRRLDELGFHLPAGDLQPARLNAWLKAHGYPMPRLTFDALQGYLKGYVDCVFEHGGRYYLLDWKSNHLGYAREDYAAARVAAAMQEHGYHLQLLLYAVALHRFLGRRLSGYDYAKHFGGAVYLFVRGVRPDWRGAQGEPLGVWLHRPDAAALASLDALLSGETGEAVT